MARNKRRIQLALYLRPKHANSYHYALLISPKAQKVPKIPQEHKKFHVKNTLQTDSNNQISQPWRFESTLIPNLQQEPRLLVLVTLGKIVSSEEAVEDIVRQIPIYQLDDIRDGAEEMHFSCSTWVRAALDELRSSGGVVGLRSWEDLEKGAVEYVERKKGEGRWMAGWSGEQGVPILDLLSGRESVS